jgi:hypothetical protein
MSTLKQQTKGAGFRACVAKDLQEQVRCGLLSKKLAAAAIALMESEAADPDAEMDWSETSGMSVVEAADLAVQSARIARTTCH